MEFTLETNVRKLAVINKNCQIRLKLITGNLILRTRGDSGTYTHGVNITVFKGLKIKTH